MLWKKKSRRSERLYETFLFFFWELDRKGEDMHSNFDVHNQGAQILLAISYLVQFSIMKSIQFDIL